MTEPYDPAPIGRVESEVGRELHQRADDIRPGPDPTAAVWRRARRLRTRRRAIATVAAAVLAVAAASVGANLLNTGSDDLRVVERPGQDAETGVGAAAGGEGSGPAVALESAADLKNLPVSDAAPEVPWYADGALRIGDREVAFDPGEGRDVWTLLGTGDGFIVHVGSVGAADHETELLVVPYEGDPRSIATAENAFRPFLSDDGGMVGWSEHDSSMNLQVAVADLDSGDEVGRWSVDQGTGFLGATGFLGDDILLNGNGSREGAGLLDTDSGDVTTWLPAGKGASSADVVSPDGRLVATYSNDEGDCPSVLRTDNKEPLWGGDCAFLGRSFDSTSQYLAGTRYELEELEGSPAPEREKAVKDGVRPAGPDREFSLDVLRADTGERVLHVPDLSPMVIAWEPGGTFVFVPEPESEPASIVRCSVQNECEVAASASDGGPEGPYVLGELHY